MANITKRGNSYRIKAFGGYDRNGNQIVKTLTWKPEKGMTKKQIEKEVNRQAVLFEERVKNEPEEVCKISFKDLADEWLDLVSATKELKISTIERLKGCRERTYKAISKSKGLLFLFQKTESTSKQAVGFRQKHSFITLILFQM